MPEVIQQQDLAETTGRSFLSYAMSVITERALPDVRDGLKPVQRRILYAMYDVGNTYAKGYKKSAKTVGEVLGKYHPHGDSSVYEAMVTMAQTFGMRNVLVDGHGNWGSVDGDPAAAMRYTEARLSRIGTTMLADITKNTVDFQPNYDGEEQEPVVLPTLIPNLLVNGGVGIAVGMASSTAPHNLREVYEALDYMIDQGLKGETPDETQIMQIIKAPDFPTGGQIIGLSTVRDAYRTGRGKVTIRSKYEIEEHRGHSWIVLKELPYQVNKARLVEHIAKLRKDEVITGIKEIRDESDREGIRVVIELKKEASPQLVVNKLIKHTKMQSSFSMNHVALVNGQPQTLTLQGMLEHFLLHAAEVVYRRAQFDLSKAAARAHIVAGILAAIDQATEVVEIIRTTATEAEAIAAVSELLGTDEIQSEAIVDLRIRRLNQESIAKLVKESEELSANIDELNAILNDETVLLTRLKSEFALLSEQFGTDRKTEIVLEEGSLEEADLVQEEMLVVTFSSDGLIKSVPEKEYRTQNRGTKGAKTASVKEDEVVRYLLTVNSKDDLLFFTNQGRCHTLKAFKIQKSTRTGRGKSINNYLSLSEGEYVVMMLSTDLSSKEKDLLFVTRKGIIKRLALSELSVRMSVTRVIGFKEGDELVTATIVENEDQIMITTAKGQSIRIAMNEEGNRQIRQMGRAAAGIRGIDVVGDDYVVDMTKVQDNGTIFTISQNGLGKRTKVSEYSTQGRGGKGILTHKINERTGLLVSGMSVHDDDELFIATQNGLVIRIDVSTISTMGRSTSGVKVMNLNEGDRIVSISKGAREEEGSPAANEPAPSEPAAEADAGSSEPA